MTIEKAKKALEAARSFIKNGIELGFIRMPDKDSGDPALLTSRLIDEAIATLTPPVPEAVREPSKAVTTGMIHYWLCQANDGVPVNRDFSKAVFKGLESLGLIQAAQQPQPEAVTAEELDELFLDPDQVAALMGRYPNGLRIVKSSGYLNTKRGE